MAAEPSERASALTSTPSLRSRRISAPPMKPDPPVTKAFMDPSLFGFGFLAQGVARQLRGDEHHQAGERDLQRALGDGVGERHAPEAPPAASSP